MLSPQLMLLLLWRLLVLSCAVRVAKVGGCGGIKCRESVPVQKLGLPDE